MDRFRESTEQLRQAIDETVKRLTLLPSQPEFAIEVAHEVTDFVNFIKDDDGGLYIQMSTNELKVSPEQTQAIVRQLVEWFNPSANDAAAVVMQAVERARAAAEVHDPSRLFAEHIGPPIAQGAAAEITDGTEDVQRSLEELLDK